jgi:hypothetical protein
MSKNTTPKVETVEFDADLHIKPIEFADSLGIRPQMVYNYIKNGRFPEGTVVEVTISTTKGEGDEATVTTRTQNVLERGAANDWAVKYTEKKEARAAKKAEQLAKELAGEA